MNEVQRIRDLAKETLEYAVSDEMNRRRKLWTDHNSLIFTRPPIYIRAIPWEEWPDVYKLTCQDPFLRGLEAEFLLNRYRMSIKNDDTIIEPFITMRASVAVAPEGVYGMYSKIFRKAAAV